MAGAIRLREQEAIRATTLAMGLPAASFDAGLIPARGAPRSISPRRPSAVGYAVAFTPSLASRSPIV